MVNGKDKKKRKAALEQQLELVRQVENLEYEDLAKALKSIVRKTAKLYIPLLCSRLKKKYKAEEEMTDTEILDRNHDIEDRIIADWGHGRPWSSGYIYHIIPEWVKNPVASENIKEGKKQKKYDEISDNLRVQVEQFFNMVEDVDDEPVTTGGGIIGGPKEDGLADPIDLYEDGVVAAEKLWTRLTNIDRLTVADTVDVLIEHIKPTRDFRLRLFKGLDERRSAHYQRVLVWLDMLIQDTLKMCTQTNVERSSEIAE